MRFLLAHNSTYYPGLGGGDKSNRLLMEAVAALGNQVRVFTRTERLDEAAHERFIDDLGKRGVDGTANEHGEVRFTLNGVEVVTLTRNPQLRLRFAAQIEEFDPDIIVTSTDDPAQLLFDIAVKAKRARVVYLVRATIAVPFGPDSSAVNERKTESLRQADGIVGVSHYVARYVRQHTGLDAVHVPISLLEPSDTYPDLGRFANPYVAMVNPCAVKGISIFLGLADRLPDVQFCAIPTWGTQPEEVAALQRRPNVHLMDPVDSIDILFEKTKVMLVPSVWAEARSRICLEAMSRGIPVVAADVGGLHEAKLNVPYLVPVNPIRHYKATLDTSMVPIADVPPQNIEPWVDVVGRLTHDEAHWQEISSASRKAALDYAAEISAEPFQNYCATLLDKPKRGPAVKNTAILDQSRRELLARLAKQRATERVQNPAHLWFPGLDEKSDAQLRLYCFPWAGGGALAFRTWREALRGIAEVCPVRPPGRETRASEKPFESMEALVAALADAIAPYTGKPYCFFGHSMGAAVSFELTRVLRSRDLPLPKLLIASAARAPLFRLNHKPLSEPTREELLEELRRLEGFPREILENPEALEVVLPALEADTRLYRRYQFHPGEPVEVPLLVLRGVDDPNIQLQHAERWRELSTQPTQVETLPGGHFFIETERARTLQRIAERLKQVLRAL